MKRKQLKGRARRLERGQLGPVRVYPWRVRSRSMCSTSVKRGPLVRVWVELSPMSKRWDRPKRLESDTNVVVGGCRSAGLLCSLRTVDSTSSRDRPICSLRVDLDSASASISPHYR